LSHLGTRWYTGKDDWNVDESATCEWRL